MDTDVNHYQPNRRSSELLLKKETMDRRGSSGGGGGAGAANSETQALQTKHKELCLELNMDSETTNLAWQTYAQAMNENTLEVNIIRYNFLN